MAIFRGVLMNYNEVYLRTEVEALSRYRSVYLGLHRTRGVELPAERTVTLRDRYQRVDRMVDPLVKRVGWRLERHLAASGLSRTMTRGGLVGRSSEYLFERYGVGPFMARQVRAMRPVLMHAYTGVSAAHSLPLARQVGVPLVATFGGYDATATDSELALWPTRGRILLRRREELKRELRLILAVSNFLRDRLVERGWPAERIQVLPRGIDTDLFTPEGKPDQSSRAPIVLFAGRLIEVKGVAYLIEAMHEVQQHVPDAELVIAGSGELGEGLQKIARELGVRTRFLGQATPDTIRRCHAHARVLCLPSVSASTGQREGLSNALLEAMASGLPVVASRSGGIPEAVGDAGILVPERSPRDLAAALLLLLNDPARRVELGAAARRRVMTHFDLRRQVARLEGFYDSVASTPAGRPH